MSVRPGKRERERSLWIFCCGCYRRFEWFSWSMSCLETIVSQYIYTHTQCVWCRISPWLLPTSWCALIGLVQFSSPWITADWHTTVQYTCTFNWDGADGIGPIR
jgi:hypothetical protein